MMETLAVRGGNVLLAQGLSKADIVAAQESILFVRDHAACNGRVIDARGLTVAPGFVDLQINGGFGIDLVQSPDAVWELGARLPEHGVSSFLPTMISSRLAQRVALVDALAARPAGYVGAEPLGVHFEGPMLNPQRVGAHSEDLLVDPSLDLIEGWSRDAGVALVTLAPELPGASSVIDALQTQGVVISAGHSNANSAEAHAAFDNGVTMVTHLFNAMAPLGHRTPNLVGATLARRDVVAGLIVDGVHVDPTTVAAVWNAKASDRGVVLVTDAIAAMGQPPGKFVLGDVEVSSDGVAVRNDEGTLAGSVLTMPQAIRNLRDFTGCNLPDALMATSTVPAATIGATDRGEIEPGRIADLVLLNDDLDVEIAIVRGRVSFVADTAIDRIPATPQATKDSR